MTIALHVFPPSPRSFKVLAASYHLGLPCEIRMVDFRKGDQKAPGYAALNPNMRAPTLTDGDFVLWESNAILQYLASRRPDSGLLPPEERGRADVARWQFWESAHWDPACVPFVAEYVAKPLVLGKEPDLAVIAKAEEPFHRVARVLDDQLRGREFVTGATLTIADFSIGSALIYAEAAHLPLAPYGEIRRWFVRLNALPGWQRALAAARPA